jgi:predicted  nucleic acid-binding Zn-ribbon protein
MDDKIREAFENEYPIPEYLEWNGEKYISITSFLKAGAGFSAKKADAYTKVFQGYKSGIQSLHPKIQILLKTIDELIDERDEYHADLDKTEAEIKELREYCENIKIQLEHEVEIEKGSYSDGHNKIVELINNALKEGK